MGAALAALRQSPKTASAKAKFVLATDGVTLEAEARLVRECFLAQARRLAQSAQV